MSNKVLIAATVPSMIGQFNMNNIQILLGMGYEVHVATNFKDTSVWTKERIGLFVDELKQNNIKYYDLDFSRSSYKINKHANAYKMVLRLIKENNYSFIHTHTPISSAIVRLAAHKTKTKVVYTAHGFHFYKGAPLINWLVFYPIEKLLSKWTDVLITINKEDYRMAKKRLKAKNTFYVPGVGVDTEKFKSNDSDREHVLKSLNLSSEDSFVLSVGELNLNKNHENVIRAFSLIKNNNLHYIICGVGELYTYLNNIISELKLKERVHLVGYRNDLADIYKQAEMLIHPSYREGLSVTVMEAISSGLPIICSNIRGNRDLVGRDFLFEPKDIAQIKNKIEKILNMNKNERNDIIKKLMKKEEEYNVNKVNMIIKNIYTKL